MSTVDLGQLEGAFYEYLHQVNESDRAWNREVLSFYVPMFANCARVLDVGCGEGQFIELLQSEGVEGLGIDSDSKMVQVCLQKGLNVAHADLFEYLPEHEGQFDGIFNSNLIEHLPTSNAARFVQICHGALSVGGTLLIATPNPASLIVQLHEFWRDATHVRLYSRTLLEFLLHCSGFRDIESGEHPHTVWTLPQDMGNLPRTLAKLADDEAEPTTDQPFPFLARPPARSERSGLRRFVHALRRRVAKILVQHVLYEEFDSMQQALRTQQQALQTQQHALKTLYGSHVGPLIRARECYARGIKAGYQATEQK